ncbi:MAG: C-type lectin domain-containing protein [Deltaproteobacteria bacterium]|nr:C-type lectin domain-containing protein [Deltaproteobacteria bacterium]
MDGWRPKAKRRRGACAFPFYRIRWISLATIAGTCTLSVTSCSVYDVNLIGEPNDRAVPSQDAAGERSNQTRDAGGSPEGGNPKADAAADGNCRPNPDATAECPVICDESCNGEDDDCDGLTDEGDTDLLCSLSNAKARCDQGECLIVECVGRFGDCDRNPDNGCETALDEVENCGSCGNNCDVSLAHTSETRCALDGTCEIKACESGFEDCDDSDGNGCEHEITPDGPCFPDANCTRHEFRECEYFFCAEDTSWMDARDKCGVRKGGDLVHIDDEEENDFVMSHLEGDSWIGANDIAREELWVWSNNAVPFWLGSQSGSSALSQYANWSDEEPAGDADADDCAEISTAGSWNDADCDDAWHFVCEVSPDLCPDDDEKYDPGQCGCGEPDEDSDLDGFADCNDLCPDDSAKTEPGICGCGFEDSQEDRDDDGTPNCNDACPDDPEKTDPGACGCGKAEDGSSDSDGDGTADCLDGCPVNALSTDYGSGCGLGYLPANIDVAALDPGQADETTTFDCAAVLDTSDTPSFTTWCSGNKPQITLHAQSEGPELAVVAMRDLNIPDGGVLRIRGSRPAVLVVFGDATVAGLIDTSADNTTAHAGGNYNCNAVSPTSQGGDVADCGDETGGGGGGGYGTTGGLGGRGDDCSGGSGGNTRGTPNLIPLIGGCPGGFGGGCTSNGRGAGGGALQLSVGGTLTLSGTLRANGGNGPNRCINFHGGGGGGSGGAIRVEAGNLIDSATIEVNGGNGGSSNGSSGNYSGGQGSTSSGENGGNGNPATEPSIDYFGGSGGGGGYGRVVLCNRATNDGCLP